MIGYLLWVVVFEAVGRFASTLATTDVTFEADRRIPFCAPLIWVYELCYLMPLLPVFLVHDWHRFNRLVLAFVLANVVACAAYLWYPVDFPHPVPGTDLSGRLVALEYSVDFHPGANHLPSLHVAVAWLVWLACLGRGTLRAVPLFSTAVAISVATLLVKQHVLVDVVGGIALAPATWMVSGRLYPALVKEAGPREALGRVARRAAVPALAVVAVMLASRAALRAIWP
ncbi:MAG TPA: phosphatase PAP2 family protein [Myxococcaceae bacterium]|nr:phosphatase PAP2 family protein [Myxococcaceae bacterium]